MNWGPRYGFIWFPSCVIGATWVFFFLPEVKNRTLEEIDEMFNAELAARAFGKYKCMGMASLDAEARGSVEQEKEVSVLQNEKVSGIEEWKAPETSTDKVPLTHRLLLKRP